MHRIHADLYTAGIDAWTDQFPNLLLRLYAGNRAATFGNTPTGTLLSELTVPTPSHSPAVWNAVAAMYEALKSGTWQDLTANAGGTFGCFALWRSATIVWDGTAGGPGSGADMILSAASVSAGAPFSMDEWTLRQPPMS